LAVEWPESIAVFRAKRGERHSVWLRDGGLLGGGDSPSVHV